MLYFQQYQEQWHILENLQSELGSEGQSESRQDSVASFNNSTTSNANKEDAESTVNQQEKVCFLTLQPLKSPLNHTLRS